MIAALTQVVRSTAEERFEVLGVGFADPWFLAALPVGAWLLWRGRESRRGAAARVPAIGGPEVALATGVLGRAAQALPVALRIASLALVVLALARPREGRVQAWRQTGGIDIARVLDRA
ncbi:MAG: BatA domain-containing protein, partial [Planctomycetota bacterium]|nr:BatA domain-containing protein [Planctomycetota bacterium]